MAILELLLIIVLGVVLAVVLVANRNQAEQMRKDKTFGLNQALALLGHPRLAAVAGEVRYALVRVMGYRDEVAAQARERQQELQGAVADAQAAVSHIQKEALPGEIAAHEKTLKDRDALLQRQLGQIKAGADRQVAVLRNRIQRIEQRAESRGKALSATAEADLARAKEALADLRTGYDRQVANLQAAIDANNKELESVAQVLRVLA